MSYLYAMHADTRWSTRELAAARSIRSIQAAMAPWAARQMYLNFSETSRDPDPFQPPHPARCLALTAGAASR